jgi:serpin B
MLDASMTGHRKCAALSLLLLSALRLTAQPVPPGRALPEFLRANEMLGRKLLLRTHSTQPDRNIVVSPMSITVILAALQYRSGFEDEQIGVALGWGDRASLAVPARMLLAALDNEPRYREGARIENVLLYREPNRFSADFIGRMQRNFGMKFVGTGASPPARADVRSARRYLGTLPNTAPNNAALISSGTHLSTAWYGNTFSLGRPAKAPFVTSDGATEPVETLTSELSHYPHAKTDTFEAVALPCYSASVILVLPAPGRNILELERELVASPDSLDAALKPELGMVRMPTCRIQFESQLRPLLKEMGIRAIFEDLGPISTKPHFFVTEINQKIDFQVDQIGIRADAETAVGLFPAGIMAGYDHFEMALNRPFLFLIREQQTNALLFVGAVMDPAQN